MQLNKFLLHKPNLWTFIVARHLNMLVKGKDSGEEVVDPILEHAVTQW